MKWRFVDRIEQFERWHSIYCIKTVTFEEYCLMERWGRGGEFPVALALEAAVETARWLTVASSEFTLTATLVGIDGLRIPRTATRGEVLRTTARIRERTENGIETTFAQEASASPVMNGNLRLQLSPLAGTHDAPSMRLLWQEIGPDG